MRIRKQASKLLGWSCLSPFPSSSSSSAATPAARCWSPPPLPSPLKAVAGAGTGELQCQLNLSPWDAVDHCHHHCTNSEDELESANEVIGVLENGMEAKEEETMIMCDVSEVREHEMVEVKVMNDKEEKGPMRKREKETEPAVIMKCKKTDGKGWHCKRDAQLPHTLCSYHLAQLRSYRTRFEEEVSDDDHRSGGNGRRRKKSSPVVEAGGASTNYYYYYSVLGPWWGKRRGPVDAINGGRSASNESRKSSESNDESEHSSPVAAVHDEAHDDRGINDEDDGQERNDLGNCCSYKQRIEDGVKKKKKKPVKKRGRKPVKARSLKSLL